MNSIECYSSLSHHFYAKSGNQFYCWGRNNCSQLGIDKKSESESITLFPFQFKSISTGYDHSIAIDHDGHLFQWGNLNTDNKRLSPTKIICDIKFIEIACGFNHCLSLSIDGNIYSWGSNNCYQLGHNDRNGRNSPQLIESLKSIKITNIRCGGNHSFIKTNDNQIYGWGYNDDGIVTHTINESVKIPTRIELLCSIGVHSISCGLYHNIALLMNGDIYSWDYNGYIQLGRNGDNKIPSIIPFFVERNLKVIGISCGSYFSIALTNDGKLWKWGQYGDIQSIDFFKDHKIIQINCGFNSRIIKTDKGIYGWGDNSYQQIGSQPSYDVIKEPIMIDYFKENYNSISIMSGNKLFDSLLLWTTKTHHLFPISTRNVIITILKLSLLNTNTFEPKYPQSYFWKLPKDILYLIFQFIAM